MQKIILQKQNGKITLYDKNCIHRFITEDQLALFLFRRPEYVENKIMFLTIIAKLANSDEIKFDLTDLFRFHEIGDLEDVKQAVVDAFVFDNIDKAYNEDDLLEIKNVKSLLTLIRWMLQQDLIAENTSTLFSWSVYDIFTDVVSGKMIESIRELDLYIL